MLVCVCVSSVGSMIDRIQVICNNPQDLQEWVEHLHRLIKRTSTSISSLKPCHTVSRHIHKVDIVILFTKRKRNPKKQIIYLMFSVIYGSNLVRE